MVTATRKLVFDGPIALDPQSDKRVGVLLNRYRDRFGLSQGPVPIDGSVWLGLTHNNRLALAVNVRMVTPGLLEVMNMCPVNSRYGILAVYQGLKMLRSMVDNNTEIKGIICHVLAANTEFIRALSRAFDKPKLEPIKHSSLYALVFVYGAV